MFYLSLDQYKSNVWDNENFFFTHCSLTFCAIGSFLFSIFFVSEFDLSMGGLSPNITLWFSPNSLLPVEIGSSFVSIQEKEFVPRRIVCPSTRKESALEKTFYSPTYDTANPISDSVLNRHADPLRKATNMLPQCRRKFIPLCDLRLGSFLAPSMGTELRR